MIKVFVWAPLMIQWGTLHVRSIFLCQRVLTSVGGQYTMEKCYGMIKAHLNRSFRDDCLDELRGPEHTIHLAGGREKAALDWWSYRFRQVSPRWSLMSENCSWVVAQVLKIAFPYGTDDYGFFHLNEWNVIWKPMDVARYAWGIKRRLRDVANTPPTRPNTLNESQHPSSITALKKLHVLLLPISI